DLLFALLVDRALAGGADELLHGPRVAVGLAVVVRLLVILLARRPDRRVLVDLEPLRVAEREGVGPAAPAHLRAAELLHDPVLLGLGAAALRLDALVLLLAAATLHRAVER